MKLEQRPLAFDALNEAQKARNELLKYKLIIVAAIGSAALGFFKADRTPNLFLIILFIPVACVYVDLLCRNLAVRAMKINVFTAKHAINFSDDFDVQYYKFYQELKLQSGKSLEAIVLEGSTILIIFIVTIMGLIILGHTLQGLLFLIVGNLCLFFSLLVDVKYNWEKDIILREKFKHEKQSIWREIYKRFQFNKSGKTVMKVDK